MVSIAEAGILLADEDAMKDLVTSPEQPEAVHDIIANKSPTWQVSRDW